MRVRVEKVDVLGWNKSIIKYLMDHMKHSDMVDKYY